MLSEAQRNRSLCSCTAGAKLVDRRPSGSYFFYNLDLTIG